jgi:methylenetetrahydrofolate reductase (NADPH)
MDTSLLVNVVHNDFKDPEAIFRPFFAAAEDYAARAGSGSVSAKTNGVYMNGHANGPANGIANGHVNGDLVNGH